MNELYTGNSINENEKKRNFTGLSQGHFYIGTKDISFSHTIDYDNGVRIPDSFEKFRIAPKNSILMCIEGGSAGRKIAFTNQDICFGNKLCCFVSFGVNYRFLYYYLQSPIFQIAFKENTTGIIGGVGVNVLKTMFLPVPSIDEQQKIVAKIDEIMTIINQYDATETILTDLTNSFPDRLKKSILQLSVQGKLVPQDPADEPASVLLERIRAEKQKLIAEGKIKKDKHESVIFKRDNSHYEKCGTKEVCIDEEIPFDIPLSWEWVRLKNICIKLVDGDHNPPKGETMETPYIMASSTNINNNKLMELNKVRYLSKEIFDKENLRTNVAIGDIFFTSVGSLGRSCVYEGGYNICFQRSVSVIKTLINNYYLKLVFDSAYIQNKVIKEATGTAQKGFYLNQLAETLIPVPPIKEQFNIVNFINTVLPSIETL